MIPILLRMAHSYGLGDHLSFSIVLRHIRKYRPNWLVDYITDRGREKIAVGLVNRVWHYEQYEQPQSENFKRALDVCLFECTSCWPDRPNTCAVASLHEKFGLPYDAELATYNVPVSEEVRGIARDWLKAMGLHRPVGIHHAGRSVPHLKNLSLAQLSQICGFIRSIGKVPLIFDWEEELRSNQVAEMGAISTVHAPLFGGDAEHNAALISECEAFVGIDSGPCKVASATQTPTLAVWTGHHPLYYHDPHPNTLHLLPSNHIAMMPGKGKSEKMLAYFTGVYQHRVYQDDGLAEGVMEWLAETLT